MSHYFTIGHAIRICDETTGHAVRDVAFCDSPEHAQLFANRCNSHDELLAACQRAFDIVVRPESFTLSEHTQSLVALKETLRAAIQKATT